MKTLPGFHNESRRFGFSLTEVAIAMAVISISLVALLGLTSTTLQTGKVSADETTMTTAAHEVLDVLRSRDFGSLPYVEPKTDKATTEPTTVPAVLPPVYIGVEGEWLSPERNKWPQNTDSDAAAPENALFKCVTTLEPEITLLTPKKLSGTDTETRVNLLRVTVALSRIAALPTAKPTVLIHATIPRQ